MAVAWPAQAKRVQRGSTADEWRRSEAAASGFPFVEQALDLSCRRAPLESARLAPQMPSGIAFALHSRAAAAKGRCHALTRAPCGCAA
jgi:hypothetical protein